VSERPYRLWSRCGTAAARDTRSHPFSTLYRDWIHERFRYAGHPMGLPMNDMVADLAWAAFCLQWVAIGVAAGPLGDEYLTLGQRGL
jgi:hypothetical protein